VGRPRRRHVSLLAQIHLLVGVLVALVLATAAGSLVLSQRTENAMSRLENIVRPAQASVSELTRAYTDQSDSVRGFLLTGNESLLQSDASGQADVARFHASLGQQLAGDPASVRLLSETSDAAQTWRVTFANPEINAVRSGVRSPDQLAAVMPPADTPGEQRFEVLRARLAELETRINQIAAQENTQAASTRALTDQLTAATCALAAAIAVSTFFFLRRSLTWSLTKLVTEVSKVGAGDLDRPVRLNGPSELVTVALAVERMRVRILEQTDAVMRAQQRLARYEESERIAHGLHDQVIQRLVATGMMLQSTVGRHPPLARELQETIDELDRTIQELRTVIFGLTPGPDADLSIRQRVLDVLRDSERSLGFPPQIRFSGVIDPLVGDAIAEELIPALRESLSNIARHAHASQADVSLTVTGEELMLRVADNGVGMEPDHASGGQGLINLHRRAERLGGMCTLSSALPHGTVVDWCVPLPAE
jgi:signal transduction histidine kinase